MVHIFPVYLRDLFAVAVIETLLHRNHLTADKITWCSMCFERDDHLVPPVVMHQDLSRYQGQVMQSVLPGSSNNVGARQTCLLRLYHL